MKLARFNRPTEFLQCEDQESYGGEHQRKIDEGNQNNEKEIERTVIDPFPPGEHQCYGERNNRFADCKDDSQESGICTARGIPKQVIHKPMPGSMSSNSDHWIGAQTGRFYRAFGLPAVNRQRSNGCPLGEFGLRWYANRIMGMPSLLRKVFLVDLLQGLKVTFRYQDPKEIYTEQYPLERPQVAERYRGAPRLNVNPDTNETMCIACDLCALACPEHLIVVSSERNEKTRRKELTNFTYDLSRCMFCGLCEDACPTDALELTQDFELASYSRQGWIWDRPTLEKGPLPTQYQK